jgi:hypothetical protein
MNHTHHPMRNYEGPLLLSIVLSEQARLTLLRDDIAICNIFARLSKMRFESGMWEGAAHSRNKAEAGYASVTKAARKLEVHSHQEEINQGLTRLRAVLDELAALSVNWNGRLSPAGNRRARVSTLIVS